MSKNSCCDSSKNICSCGPHGRMLEPRLLLLLKKKKTYGYELISELKNSDVGAVYRALRAMEKNNVVRSSWAKGEKGPAKRVYEITKIGRRRLDEWAFIIKERKKSLEKFLKLYKKG
jgi:PadR family transcriptional regulator, regulatory protein PadR